LLAPENDHEEGQRRQTGENQEKDAYHVTSILILACPQGKPTDHVIMNIRINHLAVWILVVIHQVIGFGWYAIFGNIWLNLHARTMTDIEQPHEVLPYAVAIFASICVNYGLAWLISRVNAHNAGCGLAAALICWFCFLFVEYATISAFSAFGTNPWPLVFLNMGRPFLAFAVSGLVLGSWRRPAAAVIM
jgi:hypothetical protein